MSVHHIAVAARDMAATHRFYTEAMGFELVKSEVIATPEGGWAKHLFYDTGGDGLVAFWDLHDDTIGDGWGSALSEGLGLPTYVNHLAFTALDLDDVEARKQRGLTAGHVVSEIDHGWCRSIYMVDPNGTLVEFCCTTQPFTVGDREEAQRVLADPSPPVVGTPPKMIVHRPNKDRAGVRAR